MKNRYRYYKITDKDEKKIKELSKKHTLLEIAKMFNVTYRTIEYHLLSKKDRKERIRLNGLRQKKRGKKGLIPKIPKEYIKNYISDRLENDKAFKKRFLTNIEKARVKKIKNWKKKGLCSACGNKREDVNRLMCRNCRKKRRTEKDKTALKKLNNISPRETLLKEKYFKEEEFLKIKFTKRKKQLFWFWLWLYIIFLIGVILGIILS